MATLAEVKKRALQLLAVTRINQGSQSQDDTRIDTAYTEVYASLKKEGLATWAVAGTIPDEISPHLAGLMALNAADEYGISNTRYQRLILSYGQNGSLALREIRNLTTPDFESLEEPADY